MVSRVGREGLQLNEVRPKYVRSSSSVKLSTSWCFWPVYGGHLNYYRYKHHAAYSKVPTSAIKYLKVKRIAIAKRLVFL